MKSRVIPAYIPCRDRSITSRKASLPPAPLPPVPQVCPDLPLQLASLTMLAALGGRPFLPGTEEDPVCWQSFPTTPPLGDAQPSPSIRRAGAPLPFTAAAPRASPHPAATAILFRRRPALKECSREMDGSHRRGLGAMERARRFARRGGIEFLAGAHPRRRGSHLTSSPSPSSSRRVTQVANCELRVASCDIWGWVGY